MSRRGVYRTGPRPIRAARPAPVVPVPQSAWREGLASLAGKPPGEAPIYIASPSVRNLRSTYAAYGLVIDIDYSLYIYGTSAWSPVAHERGLSTDQNS